MLAFIIYPFVDEGENHAESEHSQNWTTKSTENGEGDSEDTGGDNLEEECKSDDEKAKENG